jgi:hypothetical protein
VKPTRSSFSTSFAISLDEQHQGRDPRPSFTSSAAKGIGMHGSLKSIAHSQEARSQGSLGVGMDAVKL